MPEETRTITRRRIEGRRVEVEARDDGRQRVETLSIAGAEVGEVAGSIWTDYVAARAGGPPAATCLFSIAYFGGRPSAFAFARAWIVEHAAR
jgi:hypothetical protein